MSAEQIYCTSPFFYACHNFCVYINTSGIMEPLHNGQMNNVPKTEQSSLLCSNKDVIDCSVLVPEGHIFSEATMQGLRELGTVLQRIHTRLLSEGYIYRDGILINPHENTKTTQHTQYTRRR